MTTLLIDGDPTWIDANGYRRHGKDLYAHVSVVERTLGYKLPAGAVIHHADGNRSNNNPSNLVVCPSQRYHLLLHARQRIVDRGGNPKTQKICGICRELLGRDQFSFMKSWDGLAQACRSCTNARRRGKGYSKWNEKTKLQQQRRRATKKAA